MVIPGTEPESAFPERLGRYEVLLPIASGGMGRVFLACSTAMGGFEREVAVKITHEHLRDNLQFFTALIDEARLAGRIRHPNVVSVLDVGEAPDGVFIVMDYVEGESLAGLSRMLSLCGETLPLEISLRLLDDVLSGLQAAHELKDADGAPLAVVHRDVTPHNVLVGVDGVSRITDFGVAKAASRLTKTMTGVVKGKVAYMAPEQARTGPVDRTCDVWAVGVMAWELFSGQRMHEGLNDYALLLKISRDPPPRLRHIRPDLPRGFDEVIAGALAMSSSARYPTAEAFAEALSNAARQSGVFTADARGVKAFVAPLLLPGLEARREAAARIRRQRLGGSTGDVERLSRPSAPRIESERPSGPGSQPYAEVPRVEIPLPSAPRSASVASAITLTDAIGATAPAAAKEVTLGAGITPAESSPKPRFRAWLAIGAALLVPLAGVVLTLARSPGSSSASTSAASPGAPTPAASSVSAPILTPAELPVEPLDEATDASAISPGELGLERGTTLGARRHLRTPSSASSAYVQPEPRANPYKKQL